MKYALGQKKIKSHSDCFIAPSATVIGEVSLDKRSSVWFQAVIRADNDKISIGEKTNIQDGAVLHCDEGFPLTIGNGVTVGHQATVHGCTVGDYSLIGINSVILNGAKIGRHCLIGANALVPENMEIPDGSLVVGSPAKILRQLSEEQRANLEKSAEEYASKGSVYIQELKEDKSPDHWRFL
jgi:carbonic anhydrase/acetyltransferase-like protein (isoleucine patch superfamily)